VNISLMLFVVSLSMMSYHDGLRIITAEKARHSSKSSGTPR